MKLKKVNQILEKHKTKIIIASPVLLIILFTALAIFVLSLSRPEVNVEPGKKEMSALKVFSNLNLDAHAFVVYSSNSKKIIYSKNESAQLPLASLAKVMSALVALDLGSRDTIIPVNGDDGINRRWRLDDLLRLTLVTSSNSDIEAISSELSSKINLLGGNIDYVRLMNDKARDIGLMQTFFLNESGLDLNTDLSGAYGSAKDVSTLFDFAIKSAPDIFGTTKFNSITIKSADGFPLSAPNTNQTVSRIPGIVASKTGLTDLAGGNLAVAFDVDQVNRIIIVVLGSTQEGRFTDVEKLSKSVLTYYSSI